MLLSSCRVHALHTGDPGFNPSHLQWSEIPVFQKASVVNADQEWAKCSPPINGDMQIPTFVSIGYVARTLGSCTLATSGRLNFAHV